MIFSNLINLMDRFAAGYNRNKSKRAVKEYIQLVESYYIKKEITIYKFVVDYISKFNQEKAMLPEQAFQILNELYTSVCKFEGDMDLYEPEYNLIEDQLDTEICMALLKLDMFR